MSKLRHQAYQLARELDVSISDDPVQTLRNHAVDRVKELVAPFDDIATLDHLLYVVSGLLSVDLHFIESDEEMDRLCRKLDGRQGLIGKSVRKEFKKDGTEGLLIHHPDSAPHSHDYLVIVDARGSNLYRAYFTAWHEITHVIITPHLIENEGVRRTLPREQRTDPIERLIDDAAARIAFYEPVFRPALRRAFRDVEVFSFSLVKQAVQEVIGETSDVPRSSLYAAAKACARLAEVPVCFIRVEERLKKKEREQIESPQIDMEFPNERRPEPEPKLRVADIYRGETNSASFEIARNMRVPPTSVIYRAYYREKVSEGEIEYEDQSQWETSSDGPLSPLPITVSVACRGPYTYALLALDKR